MKGSYVEAGGYKVFYVEAGAGSPVLYVHGNTGSCRWFEKVMDLEGSRTLALDMPNFGRSAALSSEPDIEAYGDVVADFIGKLGLERPILVGHSLGGAVSMSVALRHPRLLRGLVLVDSSAPSGLVTPKERYPILETMRTNRELLSKALRGVAPALDDEAFFQEIVDDATMMAKPAWVGNAVALERFTCTSLCSSYPQPVLVIWGRKDLLGHGSHGPRDRGRLPRRSP